MKLETLPFRSDPLRFRLIATWVPALIAIVFAGGLYNRDLESTLDSHGDEAKWIFAGKMYTDLFFSCHDLENPYWFQHFGTFGHYNPPVGKYILGFSLNHLGGIAPIEPPSELNKPQDERNRALWGRQTVLAVKDRLGFSHQYNFAHGPKWNRVKGSAPDGDILALARKGNVLAGLGAALAIYLLVRYLLGWGIASLTIVLLLANPTFVSFSCWATTDIPALLFTWLGILFSVVSLGSLHRGWVKWVGFSSMTGLAWGLAISTKLNSLAPWITFLGIVFVLSVFRLSRKFFGSASLPDPNHEPLRLGLLLLCCVVIPPVVFFGLNPFLYHDILQPFHQSPNKIAHMLSLKEVIEGFGLPGSLTTHWERWRLGFDFLYRESSLTHPLCSIGLEFFLSVIGCVGLVWNLTWGKLCRDKPREWMSFIGISLSIWFSTLFWVPYPWPRFFLPLIPVYTICIAWGCCSIGQVTLWGIRKWIRKLGRSQTSGNL